MTAKARVWSAALTRRNRPVASCIAATDQPSAVALAGRSPVFSRFQATRQRAEQNLACSRRGSNTTPQCAHSLRSVIRPCYA